MRLLKPNQAGVTLVEVLVAATLATGFFASMFVVNAMCLRTIDASKETLAAIQSVQDRSESLCNQAFSDLTNTSYVNTLMASAPNAAPFAGKATEEVTISKYPTANGVTKFTRAANGTVTTNSTATDLGSGLVQVNVKVTWTTTVAAHQKTEETTRMVANGSKK